MVNKSRYSESARKRWYGLLLLLSCASGYCESPKVMPAIWFPDPPSIRYYKWTQATCDGCKALPMPPSWQRMAGLAGVTGVRIVLAPDEQRGDAYAMAPGTVVVAPSVLRLASCQQAFVIGHELVHIAQRHFDEDAMALSVFSGLSSEWTDWGEDAVALVDGDMGLALRMSHIWQRQEDEADWIGALLAAQGAGCNFAMGPVAYLRHELDSGGGVAAAHASGSTRLQRLLPFAPLADRLITSQREAAMNNRGALQQ